MNKYKTLSRFKSTKYAWRRYFNVKMRLCKTRHECQHLAWSKTRNYCGARVLTWARPRVASRRARIRLEFMMKDECVSSGNSEEAPGEDVLYSSPAPVRRARSRSSPRVFHPHVTINSFNTSVDKQQTKQIPNSTQSGPLLGSRKQ